MPNTVIYLLLLSLLITLTDQAPAEDKVEFPIAGYNDHNWYSGTTHITQDILISPLDSSTTSSSIHKEIPITIHSYSGSTEDQDAPVSSACYSKMDPSSSSETKPISPSMTSLGTKKPTFCISSLQEEYFSLYLGGL
jgi:hypothetical protein